MVLAITINKRFTKIAFSLSLLLTLLSCAKDEGENSGVDGNVMRFSVEEITQSKVAYATQTNGGLSATIEQGENIGLYAFYNNYYYYYIEYLSFAESVIFANEGLTIDGNGNAEYSPLRSWTFSTLYGTAPHTLDCMAYFPHKEGYNPKYANMYHDDTGAASFEYYYYYEGENGVDADENGVIDTEVINSDIDFMSAITRYDSDTPEDFRAEMLSLTSIPFKFTRQTASLNLQVTKPSGYTNEIVVTQVDFYFDTYAKFTQSVGSNSSYSWSEPVTDLVTSRTCAKSLTENSWNSTPTTGSSIAVENLLTNDNMLFFPPGSEILKIVFTITDGGVSGTYTWHPHVATIEANTHYTLSLELNPAREN